MLKHISIAVLSLAVGTGCVGKSVSNFQSEQALDHQQQTVFANEKHNARHSLEWNGIYKGSVPCDDCAVTNLFLETKQDGQYLMSRSYIDKMSATAMEEGEIHWNKQGNIIQIGEYLFLVTENKLSLVDKNGKLTLDEDGNSHELDKQID